MSENGVLLDDAFLDVSGNNLISGPNVKKSNLILDIEDNCNNPVG